MARRPREQWFLHVGTEFHRLVREPITSTSGRFWEPEIDVFESQRSFVVKVELAGVNSEDIRIVYVPDRHSLLIRGERRADIDEDELTGCHLLEIYYGSFEREIPLPNIPVEGETIRAKYSNGMLTICVPKSSIADQHFKLNVRKD